MDIAELLDRAKKATGSDSETALTLGVTRQRLSDYRHGRELLPVRKHIALCRIAKLSDLETLAHLRDLEAREAANDAGKLRPIRRA
jgi:hypothetical protein